MNNKSILGSIFDIEGGYTYIVTIGITAHGCIITTNPEQKYNVQLHSATHKDTIINEMTPARSSGLPSIFNSTFRKDHPNITDTHPAHFNELPYDKALSESTDVLGKFIDGALTACGLFKTAGIWLVSVHRKPTETTDNVYEYIYPRDDIGMINLFNINALKHFNDHFNSSSFEPLYNNLIKNNKKRSLTNSNSWNVELTDDKDNLRIKMIRLTYLLNLITNILGHNCHFNLFDYSCSVICNNSTDKIRTIKTQELSLEPYFKGGKFKKRRYTKNKRRYKRKIRKSKRRKL